MPRAARDAGPAGEPRPPKIVPYEPRFEKDLVDICWRTGLMGETLEGTGRFEDRRLFGMLFCLHYPRFEPESCFVAVAGEGPEARAVGYCIGTVDTIAQKRDFEQRMIPRIAARLFIYDIWRYPESFLQTLAFARAQREEPAPTAAPEPELGGPAFPAHLHIDLLPEWQGRGIGGALMSAFLEHLRERGCPGVFLETSDRNYKALPFYEKLGFQVARETPPGEFWLGLPAAGLAMTLVLQASKDDHPAFRLDSPRSYR